MYNTDSHFSSKVDSPQNTIYNVAYTLTLVSLPDLYASIDTKLSVKMTTDPYSAYVCLYNQTIPTANANTNTKKQTAPTNTNTTTPTITQARSRAELVRFHDDIISSDSLKIYTEKQRTYTNGNTTLTTPHQQQHTRSSVPDQTHLLPPNTNLDNTRSHHSQ